MAKWGPFTTEFSNPLEGLKNVGKAIGGVVQYTSGAAPAIQAVKAWQGASNQVPPPLAGPELQAAIAGIPGLGQTDVSTIMDEYAAQNAIWELGGKKSDQPDIGSIVSQQRAKAMQEAALAEESAAIDPLAMQSFYSQTVAPYLDKIAGRQMETADLYQQTMGQIPGQVPAAYQGVLNNQVNSQAADMRTVANASAAATAQQPTIDALFQQIQEANRLRQQDILERQKALIGGSAATAGPFG